MTIVDELTYNDLVAWQNINKVESTQLDFKQQLPAWAPDDKKDFLRDVSSFANTDGGRIVYGVAEVPGGIKGGPKQLRLTALVNFDEDKTKLRMEQMFETGFEPRIPRIKLYSIRNAGQVFFVVEVPKSDIGPHAFRDGDKRNYFARSASKKYEMSQSQLSEMFGRREKIEEKLEGFRQTRFVRLQRAPTASATARFIPRVAILIQPTRATPLTNDEFLTLLDEYKQDRAIRITANVEGFSFESDGQTGFLESGQIFRDGGVEIVSPSGFHIQSFDERKTASQLELERSVLKHVLGHMETLRRTGVEETCSVTLSLFSCFGFELWPDRADVGRSSGCKFKAAEIQVPARIDIGLGVKVTAELLKPLFDTVAQAAGYSRSPHFDSSGMWTGGR